MATGDAPCPARTEDGRIILNLATSVDLQKLPGVGPKRAEAILALRTRLKRFRRSTDLLRVRGIGPKLLARLQPSFVLDPPAGTQCSEATAAGS
jgi:competence protein ComEA